MSHRHYAFTTETGRKERKKATGTAKRFPQRNGIKKAHAGSTPATSTIYYFLLGTFTNVRESS